MENGNYSFFSDPSSEGNNRDSDFHRVLKNEYPTIPPPIDDFVIPSNENWGDNPLFFAPTSPTLVSTPRYASCNGMSDFDDILGPNFCFSRKETTTQIDDGEKNIRDSCPNHLSDSVVKSSPAVIAPRKNLLMEIFYKPQINDKSKGIHCSKSRDEEKKRQNFKPEVRRLLIDWLDEHKDRPYPRQQEFESLMDQTGLSKKQISTFFVNNRARFLKLNPKKNGIPRYGEKRSNNAKKKADKDH